MLANEKARVVEVIDRKGDLCIEYGVFFLALTYFDGVAQWCGPLPLPTHCAVVSRGEESIVLRDRDGFETMKFDQDPALVGVTTLSGRVFRYNGIRTQQGVRVFTEIIQGCTFHP
jgi:hypothetical protein